MTASSPRFAKPATSQKKLVGKYRATFDWNVPEIDQGTADKLILAEMREALDEIEKEVLG